MADLVLSPVPSVQMPLGFTTYPDRRTGRKTENTGLGGAEGEGMCLLISDAGSLGRM